jgi:DNA-binding transcriptional LysR family regulator
MNPWKRFGRWLAANIANCASGMRPLPRWRYCHRHSQRFKKAVPRVKLLLHDLSSDELITGLRDASLELAVMVEPIGEQTAGIEFELLLTYPLCVAMTAAHPFARLKSIPLEKLAAECSSVPPQGLLRVLRIIDRIFAPSAPNRASRWNATAPVR